MRILVLLFALSACSTVSRVQYDHVERIPLDSQRVIFSSPFGASKDAGLILLPVQFNGKTSICLMDTGSPISILYSSPYFESLPYGGVIWMEGVSGERVATYMREVESVQIGGAGVAHQKMLLSDVRMSSRYNCLIGMDVLSHGVISLDFSRREFRWLKEMPDGISTRPLLMSPAGRMVVPLQIEEQKLYTFFDTGASTTMLDPGIVHAHESSFKFVSHFDNGTDILNHRFSYDIYRSKELRVAGSMFEGNVASAATPSAINDAHDGLLGYNLIRKLNWLLDPKMRLWANF